MLFRSTISSINRPSDMSFHRMCLPLSLSHSRATPNPGFASAIGIPNYAKPGYASTIEVPYSIEIQGLLLTAEGEFEALCYSLGLHKPAFSGGLHPQALRRRFAVYADRRSIEFTL
ncbi:hypothetical protein VTP01DRAFT_2377 [Rhizomucor pusillus]|uniref:uncharacterized protein n=1 Tax=Rhizomucor pusillus TaxID=4840 RepID=UPI0037439D34